MTQPEAILAFYKAIGELVTSAIESNPAVREAIADMVSLNLKLESVSLYAQLSGFQQQKSEEQANDKSFLRLLRIDPDLEVRE